MLCSFTAGIVLAVGHHLYYARLNDSLVGSAARQQWPLRFGTAFAFLVQICYANATGIAYVQWVWRRCRQQAIQIGTIDAAFAVDRNIFMFLKPGFVLKFPIAAGLALIFWCIPLPSLFTPATLGITSKPNTTLHTISVNQPSISNYDWKANKLYAPRAGDSTKLNQMFTILASTGELARLSPPEGLQNVSYAVDLIVPLVHCQDSNDTVRAWTAAAAFQDAIAGLGDYIDTESVRPYAQNLTFTATEVSQTYTNDTLVEEHNTTFLGQIGYYAMPGNTSIGPNQPGLTADIWIALANPARGTPAYHFPTYTASFYTCTLRNASVTTNISFVDNVQSLEASDIRGVEFSPITDTEVYGGNDSAVYALENYDSFQSSLYSFLAGVVVNVGNAGSYGWNWSTTVDQTILGTASDFADMTAAWKDGGLEDTIVQNKNLTTLIEEFSLNASWSLMSMPAFNKKLPTVVNQTLWLNKYTYDPQNLFIAYGCSTLACLISILAGAYAIYTNDESHDSHFSSISKTMQNSDIAALFNQPSTAASALEKTVAKTRIRLIRDEKGERFCVDTEKVGIDTESS
ncbi:hypothetical protein BDV96DRAFT_86392 [Lophiotrema nucula]|uniref:Uncharacterized protein n=1 Tax=Lophiotrema nucula TaxID=690887 RepID=A0A6A5Z5U1_9PLEO|nr:hypothetical protein BDV96DRAFT_86392 [Lophiotrema nucula]